MRGRKKQIRCHQGIFIQWSKIDITGHANVVAWVDRMRARPAVERGLKYGFPEDDVDQWSERTMARYYDPEVFAREQERIFQALPQIAAHGSGMPEAGHFLTMELAGKPLLLVRGDDGVARAFINVCRRRGARLVAEF